MSTVIRPEVSQSNKYHIPKHRYYELKHFCLQYSIWEKAYNSILGLKSRPNDLGIFSKGGHADPTAAIAITLERYSTWMNLIKDAAHETDPVIGEYIFIAVTQDLSYDKLKARLNIPCGKDLYYDLYRKFFWILSRSRN